jgi:amino acid transporter
MIDMIGVGPFITIPLIVAAMGGPQAILGWIAGGILVICDGLVWAELGASMPGSGGSYRYLREIYNPNGLGRFISFLFIWQLTFTAPLSIASGCIGLGQYASYLFPTLANSLVAKSWALALFPGSPFNVRLLVNGGTFCAMAACALAMLLLYRNISSVAKLSRYLWVGVMGTIAWVIYTGLTHFNAARAFSFPPGTFALSSNFFLGLGAGMLVSVYDYWGYYNVCFIGGEIKDPAKNIPRAIILSIVFVGAIYLIMNVSILGVIPWQEISATSTSDARKFVIAVLMERVYGSWAGMLAAVLIMWTAFASIFSLLLGYSRIPYAAARDGQYFKLFARVHPVLKIPNVSLLILGSVAMAFCTLPLADVIVALGVIRIAMQFLLQVAGLIIYRLRKPDAPRPFRMWLYPLPAVIAFAGFLYVAISRPNPGKELYFALLLVVTGSVIFALRELKKRPQIP